MRYWALGVITLAAYLLQVAVAPHMTVMGATPDLIIPVIVSFGLLFGWQTGLAAGAVAGLLVDLTFGRFIGLHLLTYALVGGASGLAEEKVFKDNFLLPCIGGIAGTVAAELGIIGCLFLLGWVLPWWEEFRTAILPSSLYNMVLSYFVYTRLFKHYHYLRPDPRGTIVLRRP